MKHAFTSTKSQGGDSSVVSKNEWNDFHVHAMLAVSADTQLDATHDVVEVTTGGTDKTVTLPALASVPVGRPYIVIKVDSDVGAAIVDGSGAETINGDPNWPLTNQWQYVKVAKNAAGTGWIVLGAN